jgi:hypothetical protein
MTVLQSSVVQRIRFHLGDLPWESTGIAASSSSVVAVANGGDWSEGDILEFANNGECVFIQSNSGNNLTGVRGYYGSTADTQASGRILKNPRFRYGEIINAISVVIQGYLPWPRVYKVTQMSITPGWGDAWGAIPWGGGGSFGGATPWLDLGDSEALGLCSVFQQDDDAVARYGQYHQYGRVFFERNLPTTLVASGAGIAFPDGVANITNDIIVHYASKYTATVDTGAYTDFSDGDSITEAIILGAVAFLQQALEIRKPRKALNEANRLNAGAYYNQLFHSALNSAEKEIRVRNPLMSRSS